MASRSLPWHLRTSNARNGPTGRPSSTSISRDSSDSAQINTSHMTNLNEKQSEPGLLNARVPSTSNSTASRQPGFPPPDNAANLDASSQRKVRTIPAWVQSADEDDVEWCAASGLLGSPNPAVVAQHNYAPIEKEAVAPWSSRRRENDSYFTARPLGERQSRWVTFAKASAYPPEDTNGERVDSEWLNKHFGDYSQPWLANHNEDDIEDDSSRYHAFRRKRKVWYKRSQHYVLRHPYVPLIFRLNIILFSCAALALGSSIHHLSDKDRRSQGPSAEMAIIVDAIAIVYTIYITWDEYTGKPLGLRSARAKMRLIFLDLFFIVFESANAALSFESLSDTNQACEGPPGSNSDASSNNDICARQRGLASVLLIALIAWLLTFSVSVLRVVERLVQ